jgi:hypothetical protein
MARALAPALLFPLLATGAAAEVDVQAKGAHVDLTATAAPLAEVLDRLARQVGMKVVYEGPAPRQLVTVTLKDRTPAEAVLSLLEGQGVNYALVSEENGSGVRTLLLAGAAPASAAAAPSRAAQPLQTRRPFGPPMAPAGDPADSFEADQEDVPEVPPGTPAEAGAEGFGPPPGAGDPNSPAAATAQGQANAASPNAPQAPVQPPVQQYPVSPFALRPPALGAGVVGSTTTPAPAPTPKPPQ